MKQLKNEINSMTKIKLTDTKRNLLVDLITKSKNYYTNSIILNKKWENVDVIVYDIKKNKTCDVKYLEMIFSENDKIYFLEIVMKTNCILLQKIHNFEIIHQTYFNKLLHKRIVSDYELNYFNEKEIILFYNKSSKEIINFNQDFDSIETDGCLNNLKKLQTGEYNIEITNFEGKKYNFDYYLDNENENNDSDREYKDFIKNMSIIREFVESDFVGCKRAWFGYYNYWYNNYLYIAKLDTDKYMFINCQIDNASCGGFIFRLFSKIYNTTFENLWSRMKNKWKALFVKYNIE